MELPGSPRLVGTKLSDSEFLDASAVAAGLAALSDHDKLKLDAIERHLVGGSGFRPGELLHEALCRVHLGDRQCPKVVSLMAFLVQTMRSIAGHERQRLAKQVPIDTVPSSRDQSDGRRVTPTVELATEMLSPEEALLAAEETDIVALIADQFSDDDEAQLLIMAWAEGLKGKDLRDAVGVDQGSLDYIAKRVRRRMAKLYPHGWQR